LISGAVGIWKWGKVVVIFGKTNKRKSGNGR
jgi:hypothetical protein